MYVCVREREKENHVRTLKVQQSRVYNAARLFTGFSDPKLLYDGIERFAKSAHDKYSTYLGR